MTDPEQPADAEGRTKVVTRPGEPVSGSPALAASVLHDGATVISGAPASISISGPSASNTEAGVLQAGSRVAEFEITSLVGQGGFGAVYEAWDHTLERVVAIKEYLPVSLSTRQYDGTVVPLSERHRETFELGMRSFINEARLLAQFDHPSLLKVYRFWQERGTTYMVMPFYRGDTLRQALAAIPAGVDEGWLLNIMDGVTQALAVMHAANCYHRDIAPDNIILLEGSGRPVVLDFGAARRVITDKTQAITVILKPGYAPIEQYAEMPDMSQGAWTDVYALAAVMHVAVCGRAPPPSVARLLSDSYVPLAGNEMLRERYSVGLLSAIDAGLGVRPESRPQSMGELREVLGLEEPRAAVSGRNASEAQRAPAAQPTPGVTPTAARGKVLAGIVSVAVVAAAVGGGWWWMQQGKPDAVATSDPQAAVPAAPPPKVDELPAPPQPATPPPAPPPPVPLTPAESIAAIGAGAAPGFVVVAKPGKTEVTIKKDKLAFEVKSNREGFVYVYLLSTDGQMFLLFPNLLDKYNKISAGTAISLPRASWPMDAGGPPGEDRFAVLVSEHERDFSDAGIQTDGVFPQFPVSVLAALEAARGTGPSPLIGKPVCAPGTPCNDVYGVGTFKIIEK